MYSLRLHDRDSGQKCTHGCDTCTEGTQFGRRGREVETETSGERTFLPRILACEKNPERQVLTFRPMKSTLFSKRWNSTVRLSPWSCTGGAFRALHQGLPDKRENHIRLIDFRASDVLVALYSFVERLADFKHGLASEALLPDYSSRRLR